MNFAVDNAGSLLDGLNNEQQCAVQAPIKGSVLVLAGAGCGKTTVLTRRIVWLCENGIDPQQMCALTFTRKAAEEMRQRVEKSSNDSVDISSLLIATFHSFSLIILKDLIDGSDNFSKLGYQPHPVLQSDKDRLRLIYEATSQKERELLGGDLMALDALLIKHAVFPERLDKLDSEYLALLDAIADRIADRKRERGLWGFDDLTPGVITLFEKFPHVGQFYRQKYRYILVDEFQDTNPVQIKFIKMLLTGQAGLFVVGDDDQAIYGFRGADITPTMEFCSIFPDATLVKLQTNYRSVNSVLATANRIFKSKPVEYRKVLRSGKVNNPAGNRPKVRTFDTQEDMLDWIAKESAAISKRLSISISDCVLLFRVNRSREWVEDYFKIHTIDESNRPRLLTIHASKGLEFPVVFLCDLEDSVFPNYRLSKRIQKKSMIRKIKDFIAPQEDPVDCDWDEEQRLFYVGVTRAQKVLYFISVKTKTIGGKKKKYRKSRLLKLL